MKRKNIWIVVSDSACARFYSPGKDARELVAVRADLEGPAHEHARDIVSDRPGRGFAAAGRSGRHGLESRHDPRKMEKHGFLVILAEALDKEAADGAFDALILCAPKRSIGEMRSLLSERVRKLLASEVQKDLTKHPLEAILEQLQPELRRIMAALPPSG